MASDALLLLGVWNDVVFVMCVRVLLLLCVSGVDVLTPHTIKFVSHAA